VEAAAAQAGRLNGDSGPHPRTRRRGLTRREEAFQRLSRAGGPWLRRRMVFVQGGHPVREHGGGYAMSKLAIAAAMISVGICSFVAPSSQAAILSPMSSEVRAVLSAVEADADQPILARFRGGGARVGAASRTRVAAGRRGVAGSRTTIAGGYRGGTASRTRVAAGPRGVAASRTTVVKGPRGNVAAKRTTVVGGRGAVAASVPLLTDDSQIGANLRVCADEKDRAAFDQPS
jgi:hypothetical protein